MAAKWLGFLVFIWVIAAIIGSVSEGEVLAGSNQTTTLNKVLVYNTSVSEEGWGTLLLPTTHITFFDGMWEMMTLDFPLFGEPDSPWQIIRWIILAPIMATIVLGLIILVMSIFRRTA